MARRVIALLGQPLVLDDEADCEAAEAITPGHLVTWNGSGLLIKHNDDASNAAPMFALEREELGNDIDDAYAIGDQVKVGAFHPGCRVYALVPSGQNVSKGDYLTSDGAGRLTKTSVSATCRTAQAMETIGAVTADTRIRVQIV